MPLVRYFFFVGGVLLALLFVSDAYLPKLPMADRANVDRPIIRIYSDQKWPQRIVYDTSLPTIVPASVPTPARVADLSYKTKEREAFAQLQPSDQKPKRKIAKRRAVPPMVLMARPQFGWFGSSIW